MFNKNFKFLRSLTNKSIAKFAKELEAINIPSSSIASYEDLDRNITPSPDRIQAFKNYFNQKYQADLTWDMLMEKDLEKSGYRFSETVIKSIEEEELSNNKSSITLSTSEYNELLDTISTQAKTNRSLADTITKLITH